MASYIRILFVLFLLFPAANSFAQGEECTATLSGKCVDDHDGGPLLFAQIFIPELGRGTLTDTNGFYQLKNLCPGTYIVKCAHFDCDTLSATLKIEGETEYNFYPEHHAQWMDTIRILGKTPGRVTTLGEEGLNQEEINETRGQSLGESLKKIIGVTTLNTGNSIAKPVIHGLHSNRILLLNNGIRQEGQQWGTEHAPEIDPFVAEQLSVVKGANSVRYGPEAIGGVILVNPRPMRDSVGIGGELNLVGFSNGRSGTVSGMVEGKLAKAPKLSWRAQGTYKRGGNVHAPDYYLKNTGLEEYNYSGAVNYTTQPAGIEVFYSAFNTNLGIFSAAHIGNLTDLQRAFESDVPLEPAGFTYEIGRPWQKVRHHLLKAKAFLRTGTLGKLVFTYGGQLNNRAEYDKHLPRNDSLAALNRPAMQLQLMTHTGNLTWEHYRRKGFQGSVGVTGLAQDNQYSGRFFIPFYRKYGAGVYWIEHWRPYNSKLELEAGIRLDHIYQQAAMWENNVVVRPSFNYTNASGSFGAVYRFNGEFLLRANAGSAWRPPGMNELFSDGLHHGAAAVEVGDTSLVREQAYNFSLGAEYFGKHVSIQFNPYCNVFDDFIYLVPELPPTLTIRGAFPTFRYRQVDALLTGGDLGVTVKFLEHFEWNTKVAILRAFDRSNGDYLVQIPADRFENTLTYRLPDQPKLKNGYLSLTTLNVLEQTRVPENSDFVDPPPGYMLFGLQAGVQIPLRGQHLSLGVGVNNLFNTSYRDYLNRFRYYTDDMGRNISLRIKIPFNIITSKTS